MTRVIQLTQRKTAVVDDDDYEMLSQYKWQAHFDQGNWYARRAYTTSSGKTSTRRMHQDVLGTSGKCLVDHIDGDGLNNQRANLRPASDAQNSKNKKMHRDNTTGFKGVFDFHGKYQAAICVDYRRIHLGTFPDRASAARAYNDAAIKYHGEFARLNPI